MQEIWDERQMHSFYAIIGIIPIKFEKKGPPKKIAHMSDFKMMFTQIVIPRLKF